MMSALAAIAGIEPIAATINPMPANARDAWLTRIAPNLRIKSPLHRLENMLPRYIIETYKPADVADIPISGAADGAKTGTVTATMETVDCTASVMISDMVTPFLSILRLEPHCRFAAI